MITIVEHSRCSNEKNIHETVNKHSIEMELVDCEVLDTWIEHVVIDKSHVSISET